ncbi:hypothetical protein BVRB_9g222030 [Beta vulgaris subsp. vulgaris]|nr:hypothetical protein BVRB_9g222030 [Beta vulgaris subsp. vulgaris]
MLHEIKLLIEFNIVLMNNCSLQQDQELSANFFLTFNKEAVDIVVEDTLWLSSLISSERSWFCKECKSFIVNCCTAFKI